LKQQLEKKSEEAKNRAKREQDIAKEITDFLNASEVRSAFDKYEKGLTKYFKHYCKNAKLELGVDAAFLLENMHFKEFVKFGY